MRVALVTPVLIEGDAVGNDMFGMAKALFQAGHEVKYYTENHPYQHISNLNEADVYIYHHSISCEWGVRKFEELKCNKKILKYHNITPPHFFTDPNTVTACEKGLKQIERLLKHADKVWVDSEYNGQHLKSFGNCEYEILPPFNQSEQLTNALPDHQPVLSYNDWNTNILMVGRVTANKNALAGIEAFRQYSKTNPHSRLLIVGSPEETYMPKIQAALTGLKNVVLAGKVSLEVLKAYYLISDVLLVTSLHEGFCVPMIEAMALGVPVLSNKTCALPYTGGDAVCYYEDDLVEKLELALREKKKYIAKGRKRYNEHFQYEVIKNHLLSSMVQ